MSFFTAAFDVVEVHMHRPWRERAGVAHILALHTAEPLRDSSAQYHARSISVAPSAVYHERLNSLNACLHVHVLFHKMPRMGLDGWSLLGGAMRSQELLLEQIRMCSNAESSARRCYLGGNMSCCVDYVM
eukprot:2187834-Amphidinium_carterae.1